MEDTSKVNWGVLITAVIFYIVWVVTLMVAAFLEKGGDHGKKFQNMYWTLFVVSFISQTIILAVFSYRSYKMKQSCKNPLGSTFNKFKKGAKKLATRAAIKYGTGL